MFIKFLIKILQILSGIMAATAMIPIGLSFIFEHVAFKLAPLDFTSAKNLARKLRTIYLNKNLKAVLQELKSMNYSKSVRCPNCCGRSHPGNPWDISCSDCQNRGVLIPSSWL